MKNVWEGNANEKAGTQASLINRLLTSTEGFGIQGECRWGASTVLDMAVFADEGKVFHDRDQWNLHHLESGVGFGVRISRFRRSCFASIQASVTKNTKYGFA